MKILIKHYVTVNNRKFFYTMKKVGKDSCFIECEAANIAQEFLNVDVPALLNDLPHLILAEKEYHKQQSEVIRFRVSPEDKKEIELKALKNGYHTISGFLRDLALGK